MAKKAKEAKTWQKRKIELKHNLFVNSRRFLVCFSLCIAEGVRKLFFSL